MRWNCPGQAVAVRRSMLLEVIAPGFWDGDGNPDGYRFLVHVTRSRSTREEANPVVDLRQGLARLRLGSLGAVGKNLVQQIGGIEQFVDAPLERLHKGRERVARLLLEVSVSPAVELSQRSLLAMNR